MNSLWKLTCLALTGGLAAGLSPVFGQSMAPAFSTNYSVLRLGTVTNLPGPYGGLIFSATNPNELFIGGASTTAGGQLYAVQVQRDPNQHIVGFQAPAAVFANAPFNDGGLAYASNGVLLVAQSTNAIGQIKPGSSGLDKVVALGPLGVTNSPGGLNLVPPGFPGAGQLKLLSLADAVFYAATFGADGTGAFNVTAARSEAELPYYSAFFSTYSRRPEGFLYLPPGMPGFTNYTTMLVCETDSGDGLIGSGVVAAYQLDADGAPVPASRQAFVTGLEPKGIAVDPLTGDLLISTYAPSLFIGTDSVIAVRGGAPAPTRTISVRGDLAFGSVPVGTSAQRTLTIANNGNATLTVSNLSFPTGFSGDWPAGTVPAGGSQNVIVTFTPTVASGYGGQITVSSDATSGTNSIAVSGTGTGAGPVVGLSASVITNNFTGPLQLHLTGLAVGQTVVVETFLDISNTGRIDPGDPLYQSFQVTDGAAPVLGGVTNVNVPFDTDGLTNGQITVQFPLHGDFGMDQMSGSYVIRVSDPAGGFSPMLTSLVIKPAVYPQGVAGTLLDSTTGKPVPGAVVALLDLATVFGSAGSLDLSQTHLVGSSFTDGQGGYSDYCPPGYYLALALRVGYYSVLPVNDFLALFSALINVQPNQWTAHGTTVTPANLSISGTLTRGGAGGGLPGIMLFAIGQSTNGLEFAFGFTDAQGNFQIPVGAGQWSLMLPPLALARQDCVTVTNLPTIDTSTGAVHGVSLAVPTATNLIYGRLASTTGTPLAGVRLDAVSLTATNNYTSTITDADGQFVLGVIGGNWLLRPDPKTVDSLGYEQQAAAVPVSNVPVVLANLLFEPIPPPAPGTLAWHWLNPLPQGNYLAGVAAGNGVFVAVGDHGTILHSADGRQWTVANSGTEVPLNAVTYANGLFVAVGGLDNADNDFGLVAVSTNGVDWQTADPGASGVLQAVVFGQNKFVAVGQGGAPNGGIVTSADGVHWQSQSVPNSYWLRAIAFGNGLFVAGGDNGVVLASSDGAHWTTPVPGATNDVTSAAFVNGQFLLGLGSPGGVLISTNGLSWNTGPADVLGPFALVGNQGTLWRVNASGISTSTDGTNWTGEALSPPVNSFALSAITLADGAFVAVGGAGAIAYSSDGTNWVAESSGRMTPLNDVAFDNGQFVAADSQARLWSSTDGSSWTMVYAGNSLGNAQYSRVLYAGGMFFATGNAGNVASSDGQHWWPDDPLGAVSPTAMTYANGTFYAVGSHGLFTSSDGLHWLGPNPGLANNLNAIAHGNGTFVAAASSALWVSSDGANWSATLDASTLSLYSLQNLAFANGRFVVVDYQGGALVSIDGTNWTVAIAPPSGSVSRLVAASDTFVAAGDNLSASADGLHWTTARSDLPSLHGVAYGNHLCVAVGDNGTVLGSDAIADSAPVILSQPQSHTLAAGLPLTLGVDAQSGLALTYQWFKDGVAIPGATNQTLALSTVQAQNAGQYLVQVANGQAAVLSNPAWVQLAAPGPTNPPIAHWQTAPVSTFGSNNLYSVAAGWAQGLYSPNSVVVAVGDSGTVISSANSGPWTAGFSSATNALAGVTFGQVALPLFGLQPTFVAVGGDGTILSASIDPWGGLGWQTQNSGTTNFLERVAFGNGLFVAVGDGGTLLTSTNAANWVPQSAGTTENLLGAAVGTVNSNLLAVVVGDSGTLLTSTNGGNWQAHSLGLTNSLFGVGFCAGQVVAVGAGGVILTSPDGTAWQRQVAPVQSDLWSVVSAEGFSVAVGAEGAIISSPDATHWTEQSSGTSNTLYEVTFAEGVFWAVGDTGTVVYSDSVVGLRWVSFADSLAGLTGPPGHFYRLESTGPLAAPSDWLWQTTVYAPSNSPPETPVFVPGADASTPRFWRAVELP